jgi:hypothetical protein
MQHFTKNRSGGVWNISKRNKLSSFVEFLIIFEVKKFILIKPF